VYIDKDLLEIIDMYNRFQELCSRDVAKRMKISRSTLFRRFAVLKQKGLKRRYLFKNWCIGLKTVLAFGRPSSYRIFGLLREALKNLIGLNRIYVTLSPRMKIILKHMIINDRQYEKLLEEYKFVEDIIEVDDVVSINYMITPIHYYKEKSIVIPSEYFSECVFEKFDFIDYIILDGLMRGLDSLAKISRDYGLVPTTASYHYREHVKRITVCKHYALYRRPNLFLEVVVEDTEKLTSFLSSLFNDNVISYVDCINIPELTSPLIAYIEVYGDLNKITEYIDDYISKNEILDIKVRGVTIKYENVHVPFEKGK